MISQQGRTVLITAVGNDWFRVDATTYKEVRASGVPGVRFKGGHCEIHRTHLPLVNSNDAAKLCSPVAQNLIEREARDKSTTEAGNYKLYWYQHDAVEFIQRRRGTLLADEMRLGKTPTSLAAHDASLGRLVVIAPLMVRETWLRWIRRTFPGEDIGVMTGRTFDRAEASKPIVFGHYSIVKSWGSDLPTGTLIFDEVHELSNANSQRSVGAALLATRAQRVIGLTGTPIWNRPIGMWNILSLLAPSAFGSYFEFGDRYCDPHPTPYGTTYPGASNVAELERRLSQIKLRRLHRDVKVDLPPVTRDLIVAEVTDAERRRLDVAAEALRKSDRTTTVGALARLRAVLGKLKIGVTLEHARTVMSRGEPIVIWCWHRSIAVEIQQKLAAMKAEAYVATGALPAIERERRLSQWRAGGGALVLTISIGFQGLDLSHAKHCLFVEVDFTPAVVSQAERRTYSPERPSHTQFVIADHHVDRRLVEVMIEKLSISEPLGLTAEAETLALLSGVFGKTMEVADMTKFLDALLAVEGE